MIETLQRPWHAQLNRLFSSAVAELTVSSPYVSRNGAHFLTKALSRSFRKDGVLNFISDLSPRNICQGATDPNSFKIFFDLVATVRLFHLPGLHAKVYIRDYQEAIVTSGNLTDGGVRNNYEYGVSVVDEKLATTIRGDLLSYASLAASIDSDCVDAFCNLSEKLKNAYKETQRSISADIETEFQTILGAAGDELLKRRLAGGSLNAILKNTILYLLERNGALQTTQLHRLVKDIHPDLCDDSIDRVINDVHFGKKWKHAVRSAQWDLKYQGAIDKKGDGNWFIPEVLTSYWFKPVGSVDDQIADDWKFEKDNYRTSGPQKATDEEIANAPWQERYPWYVEGEVVTPTFQDDWAVRNLTYTQLAKDFLAANPDARITPNGTLLTGTLLRGKDKLRLTTEFGRFIVDRVS